MGPPELSALHTAPRSRERTTNSGPRNVLSGGVAALSSRAAYSTVSERVTPIVADSTDRPTNVMHGTGRAAGCLRSRIPPAKWATACRARSQPGPEPEGRLWPEPADATASAITLASTIATILNPVRGSLGMIRFCARPEPVSIDSGASFCEPARRSLPMVIADHEDERYLVSMLGERAAWVANVRAAGGRAALRRGRRERIVLEEVEPGLRAPILRRYLEVVAGARAHFPVNRHAPIDEFDAIAPQYPVFRVRPER